MGRDTFILVVLVSLPGAVWAQDNPLGPEFRINTHVAGPQFRPSVAADALGDFVVIWTSQYQDGSADGVFGQRYANSGAPVGPEFRANTYTTGPQKYPTVASDASGNFIVAWNSEGQDGSDWGVFGQRYANSGAPLGPEFRVDRYTTGYQGRPSIAADASGNFVIVWHSGDGSDSEVFGRRYASSGTPLGPAFRVNTHTIDRQFHAAVASDSAGNFVVVWASDVQGGSYFGVLGQRYSSSGAPLGPEFLVDTYPGYPRVAADSSGNFIVVWPRYTGIPAGFDILGQRYANSGAPLGPEFRVNTHTTELQYAPAVAADPLGNFVVVWTWGYGGPDPDQGVFGQIYANSGTPFGPEFRVNTYTTNDQGFPAVAAGSSGKFVVVWDGIRFFTGFNIYGQRYGPLELTAFALE